MMIFRDGGWLETGAWPQPSRKIILLSGKEQKGAHVYILIVVMPIGDE